MFTQSPLLRLFLISFHLRRLPLPISFQFSQVNFFTDFFHICGLCCEDGQLPSFVAHFSMRDDGRIMCIACHAQDSVVNNIKDRFPSPAEMFDVSVSVPPLLIDTTTSSSPESVYISHARSRLVNIWPITLPSREVLSHVVDPHHQYGCRKHRRHHHTHQYRTWRECIHTRSCSAPPRSSRTNCQTIPTVFPAAVSEKIENFHHSSSRRCPLFLPEFPMGSG